MNIECAEETVNFAISNIDNGIIAIDLMNDSFSQNCFKLLLKERVEPVFVYGSCRAGDAKHY